MVMFCGMMIWGTSELATIASHRRAYGLTGGVEQSVSDKYASYHTTTLGRILPVASWRIQAEGLAGSHSSPNLGSAPSLLHWPYILPAEQLPPSVLVSGACLAAWQCTISPSDPGALLANTTITGIPRTRTSSPWSSFADGLSHAGSQRCSPCYVSGHSPRLHQHAASFQMPLLPLLRRFHLNITFPFILPWWWRFDDGGIQDAPFLQQQTLGTSEKVPLPWFCI